MQGCALEWFCPYHSFWGGLSDELDELEELFQHCVVIDGRLEEKIRERSFQNLSSPFPPSSYLLGFQWLVAYADRK